MRPFEYRAPTTVGEAVALLAASGDGARPLAGGTDLLVQMRRGLYDVGLLVDVKKIPELNDIHFKPGEGMSIGAAVSLWRICECQDAAAHYPALIDAVSVMGSTAIQGRATLGGNLCNAAPSGDSIPALMVLGAGCNVAGPEGTRSVPVEQFCVGPGQTVLGRGEILVSIHLPPPPPNTGARYVRFTPRHEMDIAVAGVGASVGLGEGQERIVAARIALGAVGPVPLLAEAAAASLVGKAPDEEALAEAAALAQEAARPITDVRGTVAQRRHLVGVLTRRALRGAVGRARGAELDGPEG